MALVTVDRCIVECVKKTVILYYIYIYCILLEPHQTVDDLHTPREVRYPGRVVLLVYLHHRRHTRHVHYNCDDKGNLAVEGGGGKKKRKFEDF